MTILEANGRLASWTGLHQQEVAARILDQVEKRLDYLGRIGLGYLSLDRPGRTLSSGELRRVTMARTLGTGPGEHALSCSTSRRSVCTSTTSAGWSRCSSRFATPATPCSWSSTSTDLIRAADHLVDLGPGAGEAGGQLLYSGPVEPFGDVEGIADQRFLPRAEAGRGSRFPPAAFSRVR